MLYGDHNAVQTFLSTAQTYLEDYYFAPINSAFQEEDKQFKTVALLHLSKYVKKNVLDSKKFEELLSLMDRFTDPYEEFLNNVAKRSWNDIKQSLLH